MGFNLPREFKLLALKDTIERGVWFLWKVDSCLGLIDRLLSFVVLILLSLYPWICPLVFSMLGLDIEQIAIRL